MELLHKMEEYGAKLVENLHDTHTMEFDVVANNMSMFCECVFEISIENTFLKDV